MGWARFLVGPTNTTYSIRILLIVCAGPSKNLPRDRNIKDAVNQPDRFGYSDCIANRLADRSTSCRYPDAEFGRPHLTSYPYRWDCKHSGLQKVSYLCANKKGTLTDTAQKHAQLHISGDCRCCAHLSHFSVHHKGTIRLVDVPIMVIGERMGPAGIAIQKIDGHGLAEG